MANSSTPEVAALIFGLAAAAALLWLWWPMDAGSPPSEPSPSPRSAYPSSEAGEAVEPQVPARVPSRSERAFEPASEAPSAPRPLESPSVQESTSAEGFRGLLEGRISDSEGESLAGAKITLFGHYDPDQKDRFSNKQQEVSSNSAGGYRMTVPEPTKAHLVVDMPGYEVLEDTVDFSPCSCSTPCPCRSNLAPSPYPFCESTEFAHIESGHFGATSLAGARFALAQRVFAPDSWHVLYIDSRTSRSQQGALIQLLDELGYDHFEAIQLVPIRFSASQDSLRYAVSLPDILQMSSRKQVDGSGTLKPAVKALDIWGDSIRYADQVTHRYRDRRLGKEWDWSGAQSNHKIFLTAYDSKEIGWQNYDASGRKTWMCSHCDRKR